MKKLLFLFLITNSIFAQSVTINPSGIGSIIEANSTTKGIMPPKMTVNQRSNLTPTTGMQIYCTDCTPSGPYSYDGSNWIKMFDYQTASGPCVTYTVGQQALGGTIIFVDESGQHGLVVANQDIRYTSQGPFGTVNNGIPWGVTNAGYASAIRQGYYGGLDNTDRIIAKNGWNGYAALSAAQYNFGGYGDWYLPSMNELELIYNNRNFLTGLDIPGVYWSSSEYSDLQAYYGIFSTTGYSSGINLKTSVNASYIIGTILPLNVRTVRRF